VQVLAANVQQLIDAGRDLYVTVDDADSLQCDDDGGGGGSMLQCVRDLYVMLDWQPEML